MMTDVAKTAKTRNYLLFLICGITFILGLIRGASLPFWFDEMYTIRIAQLPSWGQVFQATRTLDLNPPLSVFLVRATSMLLGPHELAGRLPSVLGFVLSVACLFILLARRVSPWFAAFGALLLVQNYKVFYYATEARPYALVLGSLGLALLGYDSLVQSGRGAGRARLLLFTGISGMLLSHVFALFAVMAFFLAEFVRSLRTRRIDFLTWIALLLPLSICTLYPALLRSHGTIMYPPDVRPYLTLPPHVYSSFFVTPTSGIFAIIGILLLFSRKYPPVGFITSEKLPLEEWCLLLTLAAMPFTIVGLMLLRAPQGGFYPRYAIEFTYPVIFLLTSWIAWRCQGSRAIGRAATAIALLAIVFTYSDAPGQALHLMHRGWLSAPDGAYLSAGKISQLYTGLPLVTSDGAEFLETDYRLPSEDAKRFYYVIDAPTTIRLTQATPTEDSPLLRQVFHIRSNFDTLANFTAQHRQFLVVDKIDHPSWLIRWALEQHANVAYVGDYDFTAHSMRLWLVTLQPQPAQ